MGHDWDGAARDWAELQEPLTAPLWDAMLDAACVGPGTRVLDAGCGAGGASVLAASRGARINGLDAAAALLTIARERVPDGDFRVGDLQALPYAAGTFDAVIAANAVLYAADPVAALHELRRVCVRQGRVVVATWGTPEECDQSAIVTAVRNILPTALGGEQFALSAPGVLAALMARAELAVIDGGVVACPYEYPDQETAWRAQVSAGSLRAVLRVVGAEQLKVVILHAVAPYATSTGAVCLKNSFRYVTAVPSEGH